MPIQNIFGCLILGKKPRPSKFISKGLFVFEALSMISHISDSLSMGTFPKKAKVIWRFSVFTHFISDLFRYPRSPIAVTNSYTWRFTSGSISIAMKHLMVSI